MNNQILALTKERKGAVALFLAAFTFALFAVFIREMSLFYGNFTQLAVRMFVAFFIMFSINSIRKEAFKVSKKNLLKIFFLGLSNALGFSLFIISIMNLKIANTVFLLYAGTLVTSFLSGTLFFKEKVNSLKIGAVLLAIFGVYIFSDPTIAASFAVIAGLMSGFFNTTSNSIRKMLAGVERNLVLQFTFLFAGSAALLGSFLSNEVMVKQITPYGVSISILFGALLLPIAYLMLYGFQNYKVNSGSIILSLELIFSSLLGYLFFQEILTRNELIGGGLILLATTLTSLELKKRDDLLTVIDN